MVYIPPEVDELTDEEDIDDDVITEEFLPNQREIAGLFEIQTHNHGGTYENFDDSDDEALEVKRQKLLRQNVSLPVWEKGETTFPNLPLADNTGREDIKNNFSGKTPLELFFSLF